MRKLFPTIAIILVIIQVFLVLFSWIVVAVVPSLPLKSLLSGEGIRWYMGSFANNISSQFLVWMLLWAMSYGSFVKSGLGNAIIKLGKGVGLTYRQRHAVYSSIAVFVLSCICIILLAFVPHAILVGVSGNLFPSPFSAAIVPILAFVLMVMSLLYGMLCGTFAGIGDAFNSLCSGIIMSAPLFPIYILAIQLFHSTLFIFDFVDK